MEKQIIRTDFTIDCDIKSQKAISITELVHFLKIATEHGATHFDIWADNDGDDIEFYPFRTDEETDEQFAIRQQREEHWQKQREHEKRQNDYHRYLELKKKFEPTATQ